MTSDPSSAEGRRRAEKERERERERERGDSEGLTVSFIRRPLSFFVAMKPFDIPAE